jgi:signal transduction histidine kinase
MTTPPSTEWLARVNRLALIGRLLSSTVHDVNNALQVISGSVELLQMAPAASEMIQRRVTAIDTQARRATALLQELSDFVRDARATAERTDLKALAAQVLESRRYSLTKLHITAAVEGDSVFAHANPRHLHQILLNLIVNAEEAKASSVLIRTGQTDGFAEIAVSDDAKESPPAGPANLGIGIEVSTWLAEQNGGTLTRAPLDAGGSRAVLRLPAAP